MKEYFAFSPAASWPPVSAFGVKLFEGHGEHLKVHNAVIAALDGDQPAHHIGEQVLPIRLSQRVRAFSSLPEAISAIVISSSRFMA